MDFDKLKENNGVYLYEDNSFNTISIKLNFFCGTSNRECAISDVLCYYLMMCNKNFASDDDINKEKRKLYAMQLVFSNELINTQKAFCMGVDMISPEAVGEDYYAEAFEFIRQMLKEPDFTNEQMLEVIKKNIIAGLGIKLGEMDSYSEAKYFDTVYNYKDREYEFSTDIDYIAEIINSITLDDLKNQYEYIMSHYQSGFALGNINEERFNQFVSTMQLPEPIKDVDYSGVVSVNEGDVEISTDCDQSYVFVTYDMDSLTYPQMILLAKVMNSSIGLCYQILREKYHLVYSAFAQMRLYSHRMYVYGELDKEKKQKFLKALDEIVSYLQDKDTLEKLIEVAKKELKEAEYASSEDKEVLATYLDYYIMKSFGSDNRTEVNRKIENITADELLECTRSLKRRNVFMVRGDGDE